MHAGQVFDLSKIFRANDIDDELLGRLTNKELKDIGVASLSHRKATIKGQSRPEM
jgi:hypothetical protein